jgi:hypothetical protein
MVTQRTRKLKTNDFVFALEQVLEKYNLLVDSIPEQLSEHANELGEYLPDWKARKCIKDALRRRSCSR